MEFYRKLKTEFPNFHNLYSKIFIINHDKVSNYVFSYHNNYQLDHHHYLNPFDKSTYFYSHNNVFDPLSTIETSSQFPFFGAYPTTCNTRFHLGSLASVYHNGITSFDHLNGFSGVFLDTDQNRPRSSLDNLLGLQQKIQDQTHLFSHFNIEVLQLNNNKVPSNEVSCITTDECDHFQNNNKVVEANDHNKIHKKNQTIKGQWTIKEDRFNIHIILEKMVRKHGEKKWSQIAKMLQGRIRKQCRERWHNHLRPNIKKDAWSENEDRILIEAHKEIGNKWSQIAKRLIGRTENTVKNHWNATKRKRFCKRRNNDSTNTLLHDYIKSLNAPSPIHGQPPKIKQDTFKAIGLHRQTESCEDLKALMNYDYDESMYTLDSSLFNDASSGFISLPHQELPCGPIVQETDVRDLDMLEDLDSFIKDVGNEMDMDLVEPITQGAV